MFYANWENDKLDFLKREISKPSEDSIINYLEKIFEPIIKNPKILDQYLVFNNYTYLKIPDQIFNNDVTALENIILFFHGLDKKVICLIDDDSTKKRSGFIFVGVLFWYCDLFSKEIVHQIDLTHLSNEIRTLPRDLEFASFLITNKFLKEYFNETNSYKLFIKVGFLMYKNFLRSNKELTLLEIFRFLKIKEVVPLLRATSAIDNYFEKRDEKSFIKNKKFDEIQEKISLSKKIFIVHGHDGEMKSEIARILEKLDFNPIILHEQPDGGKTIIEKFEKYTDVDYAIILISQDDYGYDANLDGRSKKFRPRQNVILELGYLLGKLGRKNVLVFVRGDVEWPSDYHGVLYVKFDNAGGWKLSLFRELKNKGYVLDIENAL